MESVRRGAPAVHLAVSFMVLQVGGVSEGLFMKIYRRLLLLVVPYWRRLAMAMICMVGVAACTAATAYLIKPVLDDIFVFKKMGMLRILPLVVLLLFLVKGICAWGNAYWMSYVGQHIIARLRQELYDHIQTLSLSFFDRMPTGVLMSRITNDVSQLQDAVTDSITGLLKDSFSILGLTVVVFYRDWKLALLAMVILPFAFYPIVKFGRLLRKISRRSQQSMGEISVILHETISGNRVVKAFGMEEYEKKRFGKPIDGFWATP